MIGGFDIRAILLATLAVFGIDYFSGIALFAMFSEPLPNASDEQVKAAVTALMHDSGYLRAALLLGTASTVVGGYLVARIARQIPYFNALAYGVLGVLLSIVWVGEEPPAWFKVVGIGVTVPAALLGAYFGKRPLSK
ncbi:MAG TPA: hypothetical protein VH814_11860 [Steroidobacteraceae bacterium]|jgi:hypothetical protein